MSILTRERLVMLVFFLQPIPFGGWLPRIPDIQAMLGLGPAALAVALLGLPCGTLLTLPFAGRIVERIGAHRAMLIGFPLCFAAVMLPPLAISQLTLFAALVLVGSSISFLELALNITAAETESETGALIMSTAHGFWSLGIMAGSLIGAALAGIGLSPALSLPLLSVVALPVAIAAVLRLPAGKLPAQATSTQKASAGITLPSPALLAICLFVFGVTMTEGAMADWSAVYMRNVLLADPATAGLGYSVFAFLVAIGRFMGDTLRQRWGARRLAQICGLLGLVGVGVLVAAPNPAIAFVGFGIVGIGVSVGFPLAVVAAAALPGSASQNVAVLSFIALTGFLVGPPIIGFVAEHVAFRAGLAVLLGALVMSLAFSVRLTTAKSAPGSAAAESAA